MVQLPLHRPTTAWKAPALNTLPSWNLAKRVAVDIETHDPDLKKTGIGVRRNGRIVGVSFALEHQDPSRPALSYYLPIAHEGGGNLPREAVLQYLREQARDFKGELVGANLPYDLDYLAEVGVVFNPSWYRDTLLAEPLLDPLQFTYSLNAVLERNGLGGKDEEHLRQAIQMFGLGTKDKDVKGNLWRLPAGHVGPYAEADASLPLKLLRVQEERIRQADRDDNRGAPLWGAWELESRLLPVLLKMRRRGVRIDNDQLDRVEAQTARIQADSLDELARLSGRRLATSDLNKSRLVATIIEEATGAKLPRTVTGLPSIKKDILKDIAHPVVEFFLKAKRYDKLRTTYIPQLREHQVRGRVHCTFNQARRDSDDGNDDSGTITYRLSAVDPSMQNQPIRDPEIGPAWRAAYIPDEDSQWACLDFSAQEPRWQLHFAEVTNCLGASKAADICRSDPAWDPHTTNRDLIGWTGKEGRDKAKTVGLGLAYGMGGAKLCKMHLKLPTKWITLASGRSLEVAGEEGQKILDQYNAGVPFVMDLMKRVSDVAKERGYIRTIVGHRIRFPKAEGGRPGYDWAHAAGNYLVQGSSAGQTKKAMVDADDAGIPIQLQVHDELNLSVSDPRTADHLAEIMIRAVPCNVPHVVKPTLAANWGLCK